MQSVAQFSIVVCARNRRRQIVECLESLAAQSFHSFEIIVVDDASTDDTVAVVREWFAAHPTLATTLLVNAGHLGPCTSRNRGVEAARGKWVCFTDSDCVAHANWLANILAAMRDGIDGASGTILQPAPANLAERAFVGTNHVGASQRQNRYFQGCNMTLPRDVALRFPFDPAIGFYGEEEDIGWRMAASGCRIAFIPEAVVEHRHRHTLSSYMQQAWRQGRGAARLCYKHGKYINRDLWFLTLTLVTLPLGFLGAIWLLVPAACFALHLAALLYNEMAFKKKSLLTALTVLPVALAHNAVKGASSYRTLLKILCGFDPEIVRSRRAMLAARRS